MVFIINLRVSTRISVSVSVPVWSAHRRVAKMPRPTRLANASAFGCDLRKWLPAKLGFRASAVLCQDVAPRT